MADMWCPCALSVQSVAKMSRAFGGRIRPTKSIKPRPPSDEEDDEEEDDASKESAVAPLLSPEPEVDGNVVQARAAVEDLVLMPQESVSEHDIVHVLGARFGTDRIYTYIGPVLVALNPFKMINGLYTDHTLRSYAGKKQFQRPPHVYALVRQSGTAGYINKRWEIVHETNAETLWCVRLSD
jgi:hypothetical protein